MNPQTQNHSTPHETLFDFSDFRNARNQLLPALRNHSGYFLLTGESGSGKTTLLRDLQHRLDRSRYRILYLCHSHLTPQGLTRVLAAHFHVQPRRAHAETSQTLAQTIQENTGRLLLWIDEAHSLPDETFTQLRTLAEALLSHQPLFSVLLAGLPLLRSRFSSPHLFPLFRRISLRIEITGLQSDELSPFLKLAFPHDAHRLHPDAASILFERARGLPGLVLALAHVAFSHSQGKNSIDPPLLQSLLDQWQLP